MNSINNITLLIQLDACRYDFISETGTPYLYRIAEDGISGILKPTFGFEPDAAYIAGLYPDEADGGAQFWYDPENSPFRKMNFWPKWLKKLPNLPEKILRKIIQFKTRKYSQSPTLSTARIPFHILKYFSFPMKYSMNHPSFVEDKTIFDYLRGNGDSYLFHCFPKHKVDVNNVVFHIDKDLLLPVKFAFIHIGDLDRIGHQYGLESVEIKGALQRVDKGIERIVKYANDRFGESHIVIIGDHGMMEIHKHLDVVSELKKLPIKHEKDYLFFLDSTMARFWFFSDKAESVIVDMLDNMEGGHIINQEEKDKYHLNYSHNKFGDIIFLVDPGVLIFPNFYQNHKPVRGMHGYIPETPEQQSSFIIHSPRIKEAKETSVSVDMRRIFPTVLDLLNLPKPENIDVSSLLQ